MTVYAKEVFTYFLLKKKVSKENFLKRGKNYPCLTVYAKEVFTYFLLKKKVSKENFLKKGKNYPCLVAKSKQRKLPEKGKNYPYLKSFYSIFSRKNRGFSGQSPEALSADSEPPPTPQKTQERVKGKPWACPRGNPRRWGFPLNI